MKHIKNILTYVLAVFIIFGGYFSMEGMKTLISSHKETVRVFERPEKNNLFYMGTSDEIIIYPWDVINEKNAVSFFDYFREDPNQQSMDINEFFYQSIFISDSRTFIPDIEMFEPNFRYDEQQEIIFVKDYVYQNIDGEYCVMNFAKKSFDEVIYFHCEELNQTDLTLDEVQNAHLKMNNYLWEFQNNDGTMVVGLLKSNPLFAFYTIYSVPWCYGTPIIVKQKNELLLIYQFDNMQVVLYYNPRLDLISGFSVKH